MTLQQRPSIYSEKKKSKKAEENDSLINTNKQYVDNKMMFLFT